ncbi:hypothetical protein AB0B67_46405, partial [Streptomyces spectabilis]
HRVVVPRGVAVTILNHDGQVTASGFRDPLKVCIGPLGGVPSMHLACALRRVNPRAPHSEECPAERKGIEKTLHVPK